MTLDNDAKPPPLMLHASSAITATPAPSASAPSPFKISLTDGHISILLSALHSACETVTAAMLQSDLQHNYTVSVTSLPVQPNWSILNLWLQGRPIGQALPVYLTDVFQQHISRETWTLTYGDPCGLLKPPEVQCDDEEVQKWALEQARLTRADIAQYYRLYEAMERFLQWPSSLATQTLFPMSPAVMQRLVEQYYQFDEWVVRELIGKRLTSRTRKDLDDASEKTGVPVASCRRQFDNIKRIYKKVEDREGFWADNIQQLFLLPKELSNRYAHLIFITEHRLDTTRKRLMPCTFVDLEYCVRLFMRYWTAPPFHQDMDPALVQSCRDLRALLMNDRSIGDAYRIACVQWYDQQLTRERQESISGLANTATAATTTNNNTILSANSQSSLNANNNSSLLRPAVELTPPLFKGLLRAALSLGCGLQGKEWRDVFQVLIDRLVDPCLAAGYRAQDLDRALQAMAFGLSLVSTLPSHFRQRYASYWARLWVPLRLASVRLMNRLSLISGEQPNTGTPVSASRPRWPFSSMTSAVTGTGAGSFSRHSSVQTLPGAGSPLGSMIIPASSLPPNAPRGRNGSQISTGNLASTLFGTFLGNSNVP